MPPWTALKTSDGETYYVDEATGVIAWSRPDGPGGTQSQEAWVWLEDEKEGWLPAKRSGDAAVQVGGTGKAVPIGKRRTLPLVRSMLDKPVNDDLVMLDDINEGFICHTLRARYTAPGAGFYTSAGTILIALNPYEYYPIYTAAHVQEYLHPGNRQLPPHVFQVASAAHTGLALEARDQAILISGESGAGKTEATKHCLAFLAEVAGSESAVETQVLAATPVLEAFGNAKTVRNNNSSRFGRWIEVHFDAGGAIASARIEQYLLEKSRVVRQAKSERSYHVLYMLCESAHGEKLGLLHPSAYRFLNTSGCYEVEGRNENDEHTTVLSAMEGLGFEEAEVDEIFAFLAGVLSVGNLTFASTTAGEPGSKLKDEQAAASLAALWRVTPTGIATAFCRRSIEVRGEVSEIKLRPAEAVDGCAAAAKHVYGALFAHIVRRVNELLDGPRGLNVGVLDIFGFEIFDHNSFEQLCINFANEKLQQLFNLHTFKQEEALYKQEEVDHEHVEFIDNQPVLTLIEAPAAPGKPAGLLQILDDEAHLGHKGTEEQFMTNVASQHGKSSLLHVFTLQDRKNHGRPVGFSIAHYAGVVTYDIKGFLEKNKDPISPDLISLLAASTSAIGSALFADKGGGGGGGAGGGGAGGGGGGGGRRQPTTRSSLGGQFKLQLAKLMDTLRATAPHFIRCIKPNTQKKSRTYEATMTLQQLRYAGVFEAVRIRKSGYPFRMSLERFTHWYRCLLLPRTKMGYAQSGRSFQPAAWKCDGKRERVRQILEHTGQPFERVQVGKTLVLYRAEEMRILNLLRSLALGALVPSLQRVARGHLARECKRRCKRSAVALKLALRDARSVGECDAAAGAHGKLLGGYIRLYSPFMPELRELRRLRTAFEEWIPLEKELERALAQYVIAEEGEGEELAFANVEVALLHAEKLRGVVKCTPFQEQIYEHARKIVDANAKARLTPLAEEALWLLDKMKMEYVVSEAKRLHYSAAEISDLKTLLALPEEKLVEMQLKRAVEMQDPKRVQNREIRLRGLYIQKFARLYEPTAFPRLRSPMEWAAAKSAGRLAKVVTGRSSVEALAARMMDHSTKPIHLALTEIDSPPLAKEALSLFKAMLAWAGEKADPSPAAQARLVLVAIHTHAELRGEVFVQLLKQLTANSRAESRTRYFELLALCLLTAAPGAGAEDFVHAFLLKHAPPAEGKKLIAQLHRSSYGENLLREVPEARLLAETVRGFFGLTSKTSSRFSAQDLITATAAAAAAVPEGGGGGAAGGGAAPAHMTPPKLHERTPDA